MASISNARGGLLRVTVFTSSGTWTKGSDVGSILVQVVGAGGANTNGGSSSFGILAVASGGFSVANGSSGGSGITGDHQAPGTAGSAYNPGCAFVGYYGHGGGSTTGAGGGGGYAEQLIQGTALAATEAITVGAAGAAGGGYTAGVKGVVIVYEFSK